MMWYRDPLRSLRRMIVPAITGCLVAAVAAAGWALPNTSSSARPAASASPDVNSVIDLVLNRNAGLRSYQAHAVLDVRQVSFPFLHPVLDGHIYYTSPGYAVYDFPHTPSYMQGITKVEGAVGMASRWRHCYNITLETQANAYLLHMVPKIRGEVAQMDVTVDKKSGDPTLFNWTYHDNADTVRLAQTFTMVNGYNVVTSQQADFDKHHIRARGIGTFDQFRYNVPVPTPTPTPTDPLHQCDN